MTPVVLREDTLPPAYGDKYSEGTSRTFYTKYTEYKKRVAHANARGAIQREVVSMTELILSAGKGGSCLLYTSPSPRDGLLSRMPSSA